MTAYTNITRTPADHEADELDRMQDSRFDCSPEHLAQVAAAYPNFGKASPARKALLDKREADREAAARAPVGWLTNYNAGADEVVRSLVAPLLTDDQLKAHSKQHRKFNRENRL